MSAGRRMWRPVVLVTGLAACLAFVAGLRAVPPGETEIITTQAARYAEETGRAVTDCYARPNALEAVRLVVICEAEGHPAWAAAVDLWGREIDVPRIQEEPTT